jgi:hypothetical protein
LIEQLKEELMALENDPTSKSFERIVIKDKSGKHIELDKPMFGDLTMKTEGGRAVIERTGLWGGTETFLPSAEDSIEAKS